MAPPPLRSQRKYIVISALLVFVGFLHFSGILSTPRDFSSPRTIIRLVDENGNPISGVEVGRGWHDSDRNADGHDVIFTDSTGASEFSKVPANVGLFTGTLRKVGGFVASCGTDSGTTTTIYVRYYGQHKAVPKGKSLHPVGQVYRDSDGVWFHTSTDSQSNTMANLTFPKGVERIDYVLSSSSYNP